MGARAQQIVSPRLLFVVTEDWFFLSHFLPMAVAARDAGYSVAVATRVGAHRAAIEAHGFQLYDVLGRRGAFGPAAALRDALRLYRVLREVRPDIVHLVALRAIVLGGLAALATGAPALVLAPTGLGTLWAHESPAARMGRALVRTVFCMLLLRRRTRVLCENGDDPIALGLDAAGEPRISIIGGAGVDPDEFPLLPLPAGTPLRIAVIARMLQIKGIAEAVEAVARARASGADIVLDLWGAPDPDNPRSVPTSQLQEWSRLDGITWRGPTRDVQGALAASDIVMLLSRGGDGLPRALVEATASGRPIITTDAPGCRTAVEDGVTGLLVPVGDAEAAAKAILKLARDPGLRARMGCAGRARFEERFTVAKVTAAVLEVYRGLAGPPASARQPPATGGQTETVSPGFSRVSPARPGAA